MRIEVLVLAAKLLKGRVREGASVEMAQALIDRAEFVVARSKRNPAR